MHKGLSLNLIENPAILVYLLLTGLIVTLLAGFYPALVLSGFKPVMVFKTKTSAKSSAILLRRGLVVFQFVIAQLLIIGTIVVIKQMKYLRDRPIGLEKDGIAMINLPSDSTLKVKYPLLVSRTQQLPGVLSAGLCLEAPTVGWTWIINSPMTMIPNSKTLVFRDSLPIRLIIKHLAFSWRLVVSLFTVTLLLK